MAAWKATVPDDGSFTQLYVDTDRRPRPRLLKLVNRVFEEGEQVPEDASEFFNHFQPGTTTASGPDARTFTYRDGDIHPARHDLPAVDVVALFEWYDERAPVESINRDNRECTVAFRPASTRPLGVRYYDVENVREALTEPGEWYLDRATSEVYYIPRAGETLDDLVISAPRQRHLVWAVGTARAALENITFSGITFEHTTWEYWQRAPWDATQVSARSVGALVSRFARDCEVTACTVRQVGECGISVEEWCERIAVTHNEISEPGSGGIKVATWLKKQWIDEARTGHNVITDNRIHDTGMVFHMGAGIVAMDTFDNTISHSYIHDLYYMGISVGWNWGFADHPARQNLVQNNHFHGCDRGLLSDLGGIYTLGVQPDRILSGNYIHDVHEFRYDGNGIYGDAGSSLMVWEDNVVHDCMVDGFLNFGADNIMRNYILAHNRHFAVGVYNRNRRPFSDTGISLQNNVLVGPQLFRPGAQFSLAEAGITSDNNLLWNRGLPIDYADLDRPASITIFRGEHLDEVAGSTVEVVLSDVEPGEYAYGRLAAPVVLEPTTRYHLQMLGLSGGPLWHNPCPADVAPAAAAGLSLVGSSFYAKVCEWRASKDSQVFGPINFMYLGSDGEELAFITNVELTGALRNERPGLSASPSTSATSRSPSPSWVGSGHWSGRGICGETPTETHTRCSRIRSSTIRPLTTSTLPMIAGVRPTGQFRTHRRRRNRTTISGGSVEWLPAARQQ